MAITSEERTDIHHMRAAHRTRLERMEQINDLAIIENRDYRPAENQEYRELEQECNQLEALIRREEKRREREHNTPPAPISEAGRQSLGLNRDTRTGTPLADAIFEAGWNLHERRKVTVELRSVFPAVGNWNPQRVDGIQSMGMDERFLWPYLPTQGVDAGVTRIEDFRQSGERTVTGDIERDLGATTTKAKLDVTIEYVTEDLKTFAVIIEDIPNQVLESASSARTFFETEARYQIQQALDAHVMAQIMAANPPGGLEGANLVEQVRRAISAMRLHGANPSLAVLNPDDAADLDLFVQPGTSDYMFPSRQAGVASPLWNLRLIERTSPDLDEAPMLIDPSRIGRFYLGSMDFMADPFTGFDTNTTNLRFELNALMHVRDANGAYTIAAVGDGDGDGDG